MLPRCWTSLCLCFLLLYSCVAQNSREILSPDEFEKMIAGGNIQLLDVRTAPEFRSGHIVHSLQADWNNQKEFKERVQALDKSKPLYVYCASGARSAAAASWFRTQGFKQVYNLDGGIIAWKGAGKPVEGMSAEKQMTRDAFNLQVANGTVLVDFGAEWCPPCKKMEPVLKQLQRDLAGKFRLLSIDAGVHTDLMKDLKVEKLPGFIVYKNGKETWRAQGIVEASVLSKHLSE